LEKIFALPLRLLGRIVVKLASYDTTRLRMHVAGPRIHGPSDRVKLGKNVDLQNAYLNTVCGTITFEDHAFCGQNTMFLTGTHDYTARDEARHVHPDSGCDIVIGRGAWICSGAIVIGPAKIAAHAVIAAGAVVTSDCPEAGIYAGVPARCVRRIDFRSKPNV
jgi:acetyltransferase-like isoleucine patch superfamily enzyme